MSDKMSKDKIGDQNEVSSDFNLPVYIFKSITSLLKERQLTTDFEYKVENSVKKGENNLSDIYKITILDKSSKNICSSFICKLAHTNPTRREYMNIRNLFVREIFIYGVLLKEYDRLKLDLGNKSTATPVCFKSSNKDMEEFLLLNDLNAEGYYMFDRHANLTYNHARIALESLGRYHGLSFVLRDKNPESFQNIVNLMKTDNLFNEEPVTDHVINYGKKVFNIVIELINGEIQNKCNTKILHKYIVEKLEIMRNNLKEIMIDMVKGENIEPYAVICHGDFWNNNIMYKYDKNNDPIDAKILDFQMARYSSPILDISYYLMCCTEKKLRDKHFNDLIMSYYKSLCNQIEMLGSNPTKLYPYRIFESQINRFFLYGFGMTVFAIPYFTIESSHETNFDHTSENLKISDTNLDETADNASSTDKAMQELIDNVLTEKSLLIFKRRMIGAIIDMEVHDWWWKP